MLTQICKVTDMNLENLGNAVTVRAKPVSRLIAKNGYRENEGQSRLEPQVGLEFDSPEDAQELYNLYAAQVGFSIRIGQLYRSRVDGTVISRRFVCSKEGFQTTSRTGCPAFIRVQKTDSGKWALANIKKEHNHELELPGQICSSRVPRKTLPSPRMTASNPTRTGIRSHDEEGPSGIADVKRLKRDESSGDHHGEPYKGLEFISSDDAYRFYCAYAAGAGFRVRIGQLFRSKSDGSITSRRFVCSKEGYQHPSRQGCGAYMRIQRQETGRWVVDRLQKEHNHDCDGVKDVSQSIASATTGFRAEEMNGLEDLDLVETNDGLSLVKRGQGGNIGIGSDWYVLLLEYFQTRQAEDTGFFYAIEVENGRSMSIFWADARSRFSGSQFGDAIVFDTGYRKDSYGLPFASFIGVNHHRQPVLLGCALIADESEKSFTWVFQAWHRAMSGRCPVSIIADQDKAIQSAIGRVFPGSHHRFSHWQMQVMKQENLGSLLINSEFKYEFEACVVQSQTANEFDSAWNILMSKYSLKENAWLKEMYRTRKSWVPFHLRGTFFAGIPLDGNGAIKSYFGTVLTPQTPLHEFIFRYEKAVERNHEEERKEDLHSFSLQPVLHTKDPIEEQCRRLYTMKLFKLFQTELLECYTYGGIKINVEGAISRYLVQKYGNGEERNTVAFNASNLNINCSCKMFEFGGVLCRHTLKVFQIMNIQEIPARYILHRWTKHAKYGILRDVESSGGSLQDCSAMMAWSLRQEACNFIEAGATSLEKCKFAFEILQEGRKNLSWQN